MDCPECGARTVAFAVPSDLREHVEGESGMAICTGCLGLQPAPADDDPDWTAIDETFPTDDAAVPMALALGLLDSLAMHRSAVEALLDRAERSGADPFLLLDRLADGDVDPPYGLERRRHQLEQLLE